MLKRKSPAHRVMDLWGKRDHTRATSGPDPLNCTLQYLHCWHHLKPASSQSRSLSRSPAPQAEVLETVFLFVMPTVCLNQLWILQKDPFLLFAPLTYTWFVVWKFINFKMICRWLFLQMTKKSKMAAKNENLFVGTYYMSVTHNIYHFRVCWKRLCGQKYV